MKTLTPQQIVDLKPCRGYNLQQVTELFDNKKSLTYLEILNIDKIPPWDIVWVFCQPGILDRDIRDQWTEIIVTRAVTNYALHCGIDTVEKWAKSWLSGMDRTGVSANIAGDAAYSASADAGDAAEAAADTAVCAAYGGGYAARAATYAAHAAVYAADAAAAAIDAAYAAGAAARADYYYAARAAARKTERKQQIQDLKNILGK
jgi:hypothetical protein